MIEYKVGAALTDWGVAVTCLIAVCSLHFHAAGKSKPRWYLCHMSVFVAEGLACFGGGFMWSWGINKFSAYPRTLGAADLLVSFMMIVGMATEGLLLILTHFALRPDMSDASFATCFKCIGLCCFLCCMWYWLVACMDWPFNVALQELNVLPCGLLSMLFSCIANVRATEDAIRGASWRKLLIGVLLNLAGAVALSVVDNDCTGVSCITEYLPWESSPCRYATTVPQGASCPLPEWFNHSAIMHLFAIASCIVSVLGLQGLLDCCWEPGSSKTHAQ